MPLERFAIEKFAGVVTNPAEGVAQEAPHKLVADLQVAGGYRAVKGSTVHVNTAHAFSSTPSFNAKADDGWGISFEPGGFPNYNLFDGDAYVGALAGGIGTNVSFIPGAGLYDSKNSWVYYDTDGVVEASSDWNGSVSMALTSPTSGGFAGTAHTVLANVFLQTPSGRAWMEAVSGTITPTANDKISVELTFTETSANAAADIYVSDGVTEGKFYYAGTIPADSSPGTLEIDELPTVSTTLPWGTGDGATLLRFTYFRSTFHRQRMYGVKGSGDFEDVGFSLPNADRVASFYEARPPGTILYSEFGYVQWAGDNNWFTVPVKEGESIQGLASTPAGLLIFSDTSTHLMRGDPDGGDFQIQALSASVGLDGVAGLAVMGGVVFAVFNGEVYSMALGMGDVDFGQGIQKISDAVFDPEDYFTDLAVDYSKRQLVALTTAGVIKRFDFDSQQWLTDPLSGASVTYVLPNPDVNSVRYVVDTDDVRVLTGALSNLEVDFDALDLGDKNLMKLWRRIEVFTDSAYAGSPTCDYTIRGASGSLTGSDQGDGRWVFTFPRGVTGVTADLEFTFPSVTSSTVVEPPLVIEYAPRYRER